MDVNYFIEEASCFNQNDFEHNFADVIHVFDTNETHLTTECGRTLVITWEDNSFKSYRVIYETAQMENATMRWEVQNIIDKLKFLEVDGETMQYILQKVGMEDQMLRQLMFLAPKDQLEDLMDEVVEYQKIRGY